MTINYSIEIISYTLLNENHNYWTIFIKRSFQSSPVPLIYQPVNGKWVNVAGEFVFPQETEVINQQLGYLAAVFS